MGRVFATSEEAGSSICEGTTTTVFHFCNISESEKQAL